MLLLIGGCALILGPCDVNVDRQDASCERGGLLVIWPSDVIRGITRPLGPISKESEARIFRDSDIYRDYER